MPEIKIKKLFFIGTTAVVDLKHLTYFGFYCHIVNVLMLHFYMLLMSYLKHISTNKC